MIVLVVGIAGCACGPWLEANDAEIIVGLQCEWQF